MSEVIQLEIFIENKWLLLGEVEILGDQLNKTYQAPTQFNYNFDYLDNFGSHLLSHGFFAVSLCFPLSFEPYTQKKWPSFLLDLIPTGAARQKWLTRLNLPDNPNADLSLLKEGAINPPGNIRVKAKHVANGFATNSHPGFKYQDIIDRGIDFIDYAEQLGATVSGSSGAQGEAPKFMLVQDEHGKWHGDGAITDDHIHFNWIVKFPRGKKKRDYQILYLESIYYEIAREMGLRVHGPLKWDNDTLFIPRFDRKQLPNKNGIIRLGLESLISASGITEFGAMVNHEVYLGQIKKFCTFPKTEILEYIFRDFLNIVCGNTDNHGRNTAFIKYPDGKIELSPLFDFAPMVLDDAGIARVSRWRDELAYIPNFHSIAEQLKENDFSLIEIFNFFSQVQSRLLKLKSIMHEKKIEVDLIEFVTRKHEPFMSKLQNFVKEIESDL